MISPKPYFYIFTLDFWYLKKRYYQYGWTIHFRLLLWLLKHIAKYLNHALYCSFNFQRLCYSYHSSVIEFWKSRACSFISIFAVEQQLHLFIPNSDFWLSGKIQWPRSPKAIWYSHHPIKICVNQYPSREFPLWLIGLRTQLVSMRMQVDPRPCSVG